MNPDTSTQHSPEVTALLDGLAEARRRGYTTLSAKTGPAAARRKHVRTQLFLSTDEHAGLLLMKHTLSSHLGRGVAQALVVRLALTRLMDECRRSLSDPATAAKMKADLLAVRAERVAATS